MIRSRTLRALGGGFALGLILAACSPAAQSLPSPNTTGPFQIGYSNGGGVGNGSGVDTEDVPWHGYPQSLPLTLPPLGTIMLKLAV